MADVSFDEEPVAVPQPLSAQAPALVRLVMRWGFAKDEKSAQYVLLGVVGISFIIMIIALASLSGGGKNKQYTPDELRAKNGFVEPLPR